MRWKYEGEDQYRCCLCCHVRTGTIFLGLFHLLVHILVLSVFAVVALHPELAQDTRLLPARGGSFGDPYIAPTNLSAFTPLDRQWTSEDKFIGLLMTMGSFFVTSLLIYGAAKGLASYLMPFFCLQVFDFCVTCLTVVGYVSYVPDIKRWIQEQPDLPYREGLLAVDTDFLMLAAVTAFVLCISIKAYFIGVVWACYRYLTSSRAAPALRPYGGAADDAEMLLPPKYEDAVRMAAEQPAPPAYFPN